jgi:formylglycine-generating enzyme required for sulfatase activity
MADIFLSYARVDRARVLPLVQALERRGWSVWWDLHIPFGKSYAQVIEEELEAARCVVVVWSQTSVRSYWVNTEAAEGAHKGVLVPLMIDAVRLPLEFRRLQTAYLVEWQGAESHEEFDRVMQDVARLVGPAALQEPPAPAGEVPVTPPRNVAPPRVEMPTPLADFPPRLINSIGMEFVPIPAGEFLMGSNDGDDDERPVHTVQIGRPFYLGKYAVTQAQWEAVMGNNPSHFTGQPNRPVEQVSWDDVQAFIGKLNNKEGGTKYRLPTEAEWEYAARAGSTTAYSFGDDPGQLGEYAWYTDNSGGQTHPVGQRQPNAWGLYDMHGNVWEWVQDWYGTYAAEPVTDPQGPSSGSNRVVRGGSWYNDARFCRSACRSYAPPGHRRGVVLGFRLLRMAP